MEWDGDLEDTFYVVDKDGRRLRLLPNHPGEVADALERVAIELNRTKEDLCAWKWAIIAVHNAAQNAMADVVPFPKKPGQPTDMEKPLKRLAASATEREKHRAFEEYTRALARRIREDEPTGFLLEFPALWDTVKAVRRISVDGDEDSNLVRLNRERNKFIHFGGEIAMFDLRDYPKLVLTALEVIKFLGWDSDLMFWLPGGDKQRAWLALEECFDITRSLANDYGA